VIEAIDAENRIPKADTNLWEDTIVAAQKQVRP